MGYPNFHKVIKRRQERFLTIYKSEELRRGALVYYKDKPLEFIQDWGVTYDPRNAGSGIPTLMPFVPFKKQKEFVQFLYECLLDQEDGGVEKCRDVGATWICCNFSVWAWIFLDGVSIGWGSRKEQLVDKLGDPDSIFEKMRIVVENLPSFLKPVGFKYKEHCTYMKIINPANGSTITGEAGDNIGRGGRKTLYFKDESAHYERPEKIEAALGDNTNVQIDISSVNGPATVFQRRIDAGVHWHPGRKIPTGQVRVFVFDWRDHPLKTEEWYNRRKEKARREGLLHVFAQEVDRDSAAAVEGVLIPTDWVNAAVDSHLKLDLPIEGATMAALDVADEGKDSNCLTIRKGILLFSVSEWFFSPDTGETTRKAMFKCKIHKASTFQYDSIGVGSGVKSESNRLKKEKLLPKTLKTIIPWAGSGKIMNPEGRVIPKDKQSPKNKDFYYNLKAQGWWMLRTRFQKTFLAVTEREKYPAEELISICSKIKHIAQLKKELSQPTYSTNNSGQIIIDKTPDGARSPNMADSACINFWPRKIKKLRL